MGDRDDLLAAATRGNTPQVDPSQLKQFWDLVQHARTAANQAGPIGIDLESFKEKFPPGTDVHAVWLRASLLEILVRQGVLAQWAATGLPEAVFRAAARFPVVGLQLEPSAFLDQLRQEQLDSES